jgi:hypothetical protein
MIPEKGWQLDPVPKIPEGDTWSEPSGRGTAPVQHPALVTPTEPFVQKMLRDFLVNARSQQGDSLAGNLSACAPRR